MADNSYKGQFMRFFCSFFAVFVALISTRAAAQLDFQHHPGSDCRRGGGSQVAAQGEESLPTYTWTNSQPAIFDSVGGGTLAVGYFVDINYFPNGIDASPVRTVNGKYFCTGESNSSVNAATVDRAIIRVVDGFSNKSVNARFCLTDPYGNVSCGANWSSSIGGTGVQEAFYLNKPGGTFLTWHNMSIVASNVFSSVVTASSTGWQTINGCTVNNTSGYTLQMRCADFISDYVFENAN